MAKQKETFLADLSLHITDACVKEVMDTDKVKRYLYSILVIADDFAPEGNLEETAQKLLPEATD
jgi:hypothetical protein